jgi:ABC-type bacteriocin/lantibiotic exporter with double-glycine peptidase domain
MRKLVDKTRILVTHAIDFVHHADTLIIMDKGRIVVQGPFSEVKNHESYLNLIKINKLGDEKKDKKDSNTLKPDSPQ